MAGLIGHIVLALSMLNGPLADKDRTEFILGTSFPDIRYLGVIERDKTHNNGATWATVQAEKSSFKAGIDFHAVVDRVRERYLTQHGVYKILPQHPRIGLLLKLFEDNLLRLQVDNWNEIAHLFDNLPNQDKTLGVPEPAVKRWYQFIQACCQRDPSSLKDQALLYGLARIKFVPTGVKRLLLALLKRVPLPLPGIGQASQIMEQMKQNQKLKQIVLDFYKNFQLIITPPFDTTNK